MFYLFAVPRWHFRYKKQAGPGRRPDNQNTGLFQNLWAVPSNQWLRLKFPTLTDCRLNPIILPSPPGLQSPSSHCHSPCRLFLKETKPHHVLWARKFQCRKFLGLPELVNFLLARKQKTSRLPLPQLKLLVFFLYAYYKYRLKLVKNQRIIMRISFGNRS